MEKQLCYKSWETYKGTNRVLCHVMTGQEDPHICVFQHPVFRDAARVVQPD